MNKPLRLCRGVMVSAGLVIACVAAGGPGGQGANPIDELVQRLSGDPLWENGLRPTISLPRSASPVQVAATFLDTQHATLLELVATRNVEIPNGYPGPYTAVLVNSSLGRKVLLIRLMEHDSRWDVRMFDAPWR